MNAPARVVDMDEGAEVQVAMEQLGVSAAEINQQIATAKRYPRSLARFRQNLIGNVTLSPEIAASCIYALPRAGKKIEGKSIRFAEIAMGEWGNCRASARIVAETDHFICAQGIFIDLERNVAVGIEVSRRIVDKYGKRFDIDMIGVTGAAASSIALRNAILRGIPTAFTDEAYIAAKRTISGNLATLQDRRNRMLEAFKPYNITEAQIIAAVGKQGLVEIGLGELMTLGGYLTSIQEGIKDPEDIFAPVESAARKPAPQQQQAPQQQEKPAAQTQSPSGGGSAGADAPKADGGEGGQGQAPPADTLAKLEATIANELADAKTRADVQAIAGMFAQDVADLDGEATARIEKLFDDARAAIDAAATGPDDFPGDRPMGGR